MLISFIPFGYMIIKFYFILFYYFYDFQLLRTMLGYMSTVNMITPDNTTHSEDQLLYYSTEVCYRAFISVITERLTHYT